MVEADRQVSGADGSLGVGTGCFLTRELKHGMRPKFQRVRLPNEKHIVWLDEGRHSDEPLKSGTHGDLPQETAMLSAQT